MPASKRRSSRRSKRKVPAPVVVYVAEITSRLRLHDAWRMLKQIRPALDVATVKDRLLAYLKARDWWSRDYSSAEYRVRAYSRIEGRVLDNNDLRDARDKLKQTEGGAA